MGFQTLRRFDPDYGRRGISASPGLHAVRRLPAAIYFRRGIPPSEGELLI